MIHVAILASSPEMSAQFKRHLVMLRRSGVATFHDQIDADTKLVLLVLDVTMLAEREEEMDAAERALEAGVTVCVVLSAPLDLLQFREACPTRKPIWFERLTRMPYATRRDQNGRPLGVTAEGLPVSTWVDHNDAWTEVAREVREVVDAIATTGGGG